MTDEHWFVAQRIGKTEGQLCIGEGFVRPAGRRGRYAAKRSRD